MSATFQNGTISLASETDAYVVDLVDGTYARAAKVLPIGDSLTYGYGGSTSDYTSEELAALKGYRGPLFDAILAQGGWVDYVGGLQTGPDDMLDPDHAGTPGQRLSEIVGEGLSEHSDLSGNLAEHAPDITLLMAGTNDFNAQTGAAFESRFANILNSMEQALGQFLSYAGSASTYLLVSTLAPKIRDLIPEENAYMLNQGYSLDNGALVVGDNGTGTYTPGIIALVEEYHALDSRIILVENPVTTAELSADGIHFTDEGFDLYASALFDALLAEIGLVDGTFVNAASDTQASQNVEGGAAGDRITGNDAANTITGNGGADYITLGGGADVVAFGSAALDGARDVVTDLNPGEGDRIDLTDLAAALGITMETLLGRLSFTETGSGTELAVDVDGSAVRLAFFEGATEAEVMLALEDPPVNDPPTITSPDGFAFVEGGTGPVFTAAATDPEDDAIAFSLDGGDADLFAIDAVTGEVTLVTPPTFSTEISDVVKSFVFDVVVSDGTNEARQSVTVDVLRDSDGDTIADVEDNAILVFNTDQADSNGDGYGDVLDADMDGNGRVNALDFSILASSFNTQAGDPDFDVRADLNYDNRITALDFSVFSPHFNTELPQLSYVDLFGL